VTAASFGPVDCRRTKNTAAFNLCDDLLKIHRRRARIKDRDQHNIVVQVPTVPIFGQHKKNRNFENA
jgi:hypothetical protein